MPFQLHWMFDVRDPRSLLPKPPEGEPQKIVPYGVILAGEWPFPLGAKLRLPQGYLFTAPENPEATRLQLRKGNPSRVELHPYRTKVAWPACLITFGARLFETAVALAMAAKAEEACWIVSPPVDQPDGAVVWAALALREP